MQNILKANENKRYRKPQKNTALLSGILRCKECGSFMRPKIQSGRFDSDGNLKYNYMCELKEKSKKQKCNCKNIDGNELDKILMENVKKLIASNSKICSELRRISTTKVDIVKEDNEETHLRYLYEKNQKDLENLIQKIKYVDISLIDDINKEVKRIKKDNEELEAKLEAFNKEKEVKKQDIDISKIILEIIEKHFEQFDDLDILEKRNLLKLIIESAIGNGESVEINLLNSNTSSFFNTNLFPTCVNSK